MLRKKSLSQQCTSFFNAAKCFFNIRTMLRKYNTIIAKMRRVIKQNDWGSREPLLGCFSKKSKGCTWALDLLKGHVKSPNE
jgi:hypothetical protein